MKSPHQKTVILTGSGISAESGLPTFRDKGGLREGHRAAEFATSEAFEKDSEPVHHFHNLRRAALETIHPNGTHLTIAKLERAVPGRITLISQNIDDSHERAGYF